MARLAQKNGPTDGEQNLMIHRAAEVPNGKEIDAA